MATEAHFQLGKFARDEGKYEKAEKHYLKSIEIQPKSPGAHVMLGVTLRDVGRLEEALKRAKSSDRSHVIVIDTDPMITTEAGGNWWDVAVPEVSERAEVNTARRAYLEERARQRSFD